MPQPLATSTPPPVPDVIRHRHQRLAHQVQHTLQRIGIEHRNADGSVFTPRVERIAWTPDGCIALIKLDESRLWHIPSSRLTNADTLRKLRRTIGQPIAVLETDHTGALIPGIWYVVSFMPQAPLPESLRLTLEQIEAIERDRLLVPIGQFQRTTGIAYRPLDQFGHTLIGSATQRGKTSFINAMIGALAARNTPECYELYVIDAKATTLHRWRGVAHLQQYATTVVEATSVLEQIEQLSNERFALIRAAQADGWRDYNTRVSRPLPAIHVVVDEVPDLFFQDGGPAGEFATLLARLAGKVLGAGIFLTIAGTQMGADVLPPLLRANMMTRIAFQTADRYRSLAVLNDVGAEKLPAIKGRALWRDTEHPTRLIETQMVYLNADDVHTIVALNRAESPLTSESSTSPMSDQFVPTIDGVKPDLAHAVAEWVATREGATVRSVWDEFRERGLSYGKVKLLLAEWEALGLLGAQPSVNQPRPVLRAMLSRLGLDREVV